MQNVILLIALHKMSDQERDYDDFDIENDYYPLIQACYQRR